jgi:hypothetical protein
MPDLLEQRLSELAGDLHVPVPDELEAAVMARVRVSRSGRRWRRWVAGLLLALLAGGVAASPVGASIREWLGFHGVGVTSGDDVTGTPVVPTATGTPDLEEAASVVGFMPVVPAVLGPPDGVEVSGDGLVASLSWSTASGTLRLDQFHGTVEPLFWKTTPQAVHVSVSGSDALWLPTAHRVTVMSDEGDVRQLPSRLAAPTLVWLDDGLTLRLEGELTLAEATRVAQSVP